MPPATTTDYPRQTPIVEQGSGLLTVPWDHFFQALATLAITVNAIPGTNLFTLAAQPSLGAGDAGYIGWVTDFGHAVRWTGAVWEFAPGDPGNGFFQHYAIAPQAVGWQECDGTATTYLTVGGATLTATAITPPDLKTTGAYLKSGAAYTGVVVPIAGVTSAPDLIAIHAVAAGADYTVSDYTHVHDISTFDPRHLTGRIYFRR